MRVKRGRFDVAAVGFEEVTGLNNILGQYIDYIAIEMRAHHDAQ